MKRFLLLLICFASFLNTYAQKKNQKGISYNKANNKNDQFLQKQWWIGLKAGANLAKTTVDNSYVIISPTNYEPTLTNKKYDKFNLIGKQITIEATFYFKGISLSLQPTYQNSRFSYSNDFEWRDREIESNLLRLKYEQLQQVEHFVLPLLAKYEIAGSKIRPYIQAGVYGAYLLNATKEVRVSGVDFASGGERGFKNEPIIVGAKDLFAKNHYGILGGAGFYYNLGNVRLNFDVQYKYGLTNISSTKNRYENDRLIGIGDAMDDLLLDNLSISIGTLFPLRFLSSGFKSLENK